MTEKQCSLGYGLLVSCLVVAGLMAGTPSTLAQSRSGAPFVAEASPVWARITAHPRLFATADKFSAITQQEDAISVQMRELIRAQADEALVAPDVVLPDVASATGELLFLPFRQLQGHILVLAFEYRLTHDRRYLERARGELLQLAAMRTWNPAHFLDVGEAALAAGIGYDWLYDDLSTIEKTKIEDAILHNALLPSLEAKEGTGGWVDGDFNWNQVCNGALAVAALAIEERDPQVTRRVVERAIRNIPKAGATYAPDGSYPEGPSYWIYGTSFQVFFVEALRSALASSFSLDRMPGFLASADFKQQMVAPSGEDYNFADYHAENLEEPLMIWFARERGDRALAETQLKKLRRLLDLAMAPDAHAAGIVASRHLLFNLLWWQPDLPRRTAGQSLLWSAQGVLPIAAMRSAWHDRCASFVAVKGGTPDHSHAHMDVGSFILEANGVRWAVDLGSESYDRMRAANLTLWSYAQNSNRWDVFREGPEGHNILRFNGAPQAVSGRGEMITTPTDEAPEARLDLGSLYRPNATEVSRSLRLEDDHSVLIQDTWTSGSAEQTVSWQWLTQADVEPQTDGFLLRQAGESLRLQVVANFPYKQVVEDVSAPRHAYDSPNPHLKRLTIKVFTAARKSGWLTVHAVPGPMRDDALRSAACSIPAE